MTDRADFGHRGGDEDAERTMTRWKAQVEYMTASGRVLTWSGDVSARTLRQACAEAVETTRKARPSARGMAEILRVEAHRILHAGPGAAPEPASPVAASPAP
jgi:hypothetical protein